MIQKNTYIIPSDKTGVLVVKVFHLYKGFFFLLSSIGDIVKVSVLTTKPDNWLVKKTKLNLIIVNTTKEIRKKDNSYLRFQYNTGVLLKNRLTSKSKEVIGPAVFQLKRRKFLKSFSGVL